MANKFNLCEPYSFQTLKLRLEQENESRKVKKANGEAIYGLEQFTLEQFFQYRLSTAEASLRTYLEGQRDERILKEAKHEGVKSPYHVYARTQSYQTSKVKFYQIPDKILLHLGLNENCDR